MTTPLASIVIPTFNRISALRLVLSALEEQVISDDVEIEVVVVDDGSSDGTWPWLQRLRRQRRRLPLIICRQANAGPAKARNQGVALAHGELVLFLGDDTVPQRGWLMAHLEEHRLFGSSCRQRASEPRDRTADPNAGDRQLAVLGYTSFPSEDDSPFCRWINEMGAQFGYQLIDSPREVPFNFFYTSNISLPRSVLRELGGFREDFPAAAWEDIELSYRATRNGMRLVYQPRARTLHLHRISPATFSRRQRTSGASAAIFAGLHPELAGFLGLERHGMPRPLAGLRELLLRSLVLVGEQLPGVLPARCYHALLDLAYQQGLRTSQQRKT